MLREASSVFCEFLEVAVHTLLYSRGVYPPEIFERRRYIDPLFSFVLILEDFMFLRGMKEIQYPSEAESIQGAEPIYRRGSSRSTFLDD
jgi:hypothetical protein